MKLSDYEIGWLVGILEGEGCFSYATRTQNVQLNMIDADVVNTVANILSRFLECEIIVTSVFPNKSVKGTIRQEQYRVSVCGERARAIMELVKPYMHSRRRARIWQSLNKYQARTSKLSDDLLAQIRKNINDRSIAADARTSSNESSDDLEYADTGSSGDEAAGDRG